MAAAHALDPLVLALGLLVGIAAERWLHRLLAVAALASLLGVAIAGMSDLGPDPWRGASAVARGLALLLWSMVGWGARLILKRFSRSS
jgi:hypothetical protein